ncbi:MAG: hypothetical protein HQK97_01625 [Nitrospirae bacterium]|nr:hypothetical protein [Nitrospirota bacterium]
MFKILNVKVLLVVSVIIGILTIKISAGSSNEKIVFLGDSHMAYTDWNSMFSHVNILNHGIGGNASQDIYNRLGLVIKDNPKKIFIMVGTNDIIRGVTPDNFILTYDKILHVLIKRLPHAEVYVMTILPGYFENDTLFNSVVLMLNAKIKQAVEKYKKHDNIKFLDIHESFMLPGTLRLNPAYTFDGIHLTDQGYLNWKQQIMPYVH